MNAKTLEFANKIPGWLSIHEGQFLEKIAKSTEQLKGAVVEIGSFYGRSTVFIAQTKGKTYSVDPHLGNVEPTLKFPNTYKKFIKNMKDAHIKNRKIYRIG